MDVSKNRGTPKSWILIGFSIMNYPFWGKTHYLWVDTHIAIKKPYQATMEPWPDSPDSPDGGWSLLTGCDFQDDGSMG